MAYIKRYIDRVTREEVTKWNGYHYFCIKTTKEIVDKEFDELAYCVSGYWRAYCKVLATYEGTDDYNELFSKVEGVVNGKDLSLLKCDWSDKDGFEIGDVDPDYDHVFESKISQKAYTPTEVLNLILREGP